jgi:hypothetical protein
MKFRYIVIISFFWINTITFCQDKTKDFQLFSKENLEFTALKSCFYLVCQEYVLIDYSGNPKGRGGNDFYGKVYTIGVQGIESKIWFPSYIRFPWEIDKTFDRKNTKNLEPECSAFRIKRYTDKSFYNSKLQPSNDNSLISFFVFGTDGIPFDSIKSNNGTLIIFHSSKSFPDDFVDLSKSIITLDNITWNNENISEIENLNFGNDQILGGTLFSRYITPGKIEWKLSGFYLLVKNKWVLKSTYGLN